MCSNFEAGINEDLDRADGKPIRRKKYQLYKAKETMTLPELLLTKLHVTSVGTMKYCLICDTFSLKQCIGIGLGRRDSDDETDASGAVMSDTVAGTFKQHWKLQWSVEFRLYVFILSMVIFYCYFASQFCWYWRALPTITVGCIMFNRKWPCIRMWADTIVADHSEAFLAIDEFSFTVDNKEYKIPLGLQVTL